MQKLTTARLNRGWSIQQLADRSGVQRQTISRLEHGRTWPRANTLWKLSQALGVQPAELVGEVPEAASEGDPELEEAAAGLEGLSDVADIRAYALSWAGSGPDALSRLDALAGAVEKGRPVTAWIIRAAFYDLGAEMLASGQITPKEARQTEGHHAA
jgi:transcriptional regulator with XRE-family HTH domain